MISPSNREVDISLDRVYGKTENEFIGMCRREVMDAFMRDRAAKLGANLINGLVTKIDTGTNRQGPYKITYSDYAAGEATGEAVISTSPERFLRISQNFLFIDSHNSSYI